MLYMFSTLVEQTASNSFRIMLVTLIGLDTETNFFCYHAELLIHGFLEEII